MWNLLKNKGFNSITLLTTYEYNWVDKVKRCVIHTKHNVTDFDLEFEWKIALIIRDHFKSSESDHMECVSTEPPLYTGGKKKMSKKPETVYSAVSTARIKGIKDG